jgi:ComF family protein
MEMFQLAAESLFSVLFPSDCRICGASLKRISNLPVCEKCLESIVPLEGRLCSACGEQLFAHLAGVGSDPVCGLCRRATPRFRKAVAFGAYHGVLRELVHILKYQRVRSASPVLGRLLGQAVSRAELPANAMLVVPVPLARGKQRARGFNQAEEIARSFVRSQPGRSIQLEATLLTRTRETTSQTGLTRLQRQANLRGAFSVNRPEKLRDRSILLVDDVMTTGATAGECARMLLRAGAKEVFVATAARATREAASLRMMAHAAGAQWGGKLGHA